MRVISIIVHFIALRDPALHKSTEDAAHPSLLNKRGVNFALHLSLSVPLPSLGAALELSLTKATSEIHRVLLKCVCQTLLGRDN